MFHRWAALVLVLALCAMSPKNAAGQAQVQPPRGHSAGKIGGSFPNPFNPDTHILFNVGPDDCTGVSQKYVVSMRIVNVLGQTVVIPKLYGSAPNTTPVPSSMNGPIANLTLGCGNYNAWWDGKLANGREAPSGAYAAQLFVDNKVAAAYRIFYAK